MNISLKEFFKTNINDEVLKNKVICFNASEYSSIFFSQILKILKPNHLNKIFININNDVDLLSLKLQFEQSFLGYNNFYWLGNISDYKNKKELLSYLDSYEGFHHISFFISEDIANSFDNKLIVICDDFITSEHFNSLLKLWPSNKHDLIKLFIKKIFETNNKLSLDQICLFANYALFLGARHSSFIDNWLDKILINEHSFFTLSKYFFAFDSKNFYKYFNSLPNDYAPIFWTTYWSEQIYRAFNFIYLREQGKNLQAKQIAYKLPFSFIQTDWKKTSLEELKNAHQFIYDLDCLLKNGASDFSLELFYAKFLSREFKNSLDAD